MLDTIYIGLSGMQAYSHGLNVISNNVANLNTVGFKTSSADFKDLVFQSAAASLNGLYSDGACGRPASSADCCRFSLLTGLSKKISDAACTPIAVWPPTVP